jgi:type IV pilus assembly protein PilX
MKHTHSIKAATRRVRTAPRRLARGISLIFALMALVAISLAAVALIRSVDTGSLIVGNVSFKQDALVTAEQAAEQAIAWIAPQVAGTALHADIEASGYYATSLDNLDVTGGTTGNNGRAVVDWLGDNCASYTAGTYTLCKPARAQVTLTGGNTARWVITRLCASAGNPQSVGVDCAATLTTSSQASTSRGEVSYSTDRLADSAYSQYYRIVVRAQGARGTLAFTETIVHF